MWAENESTLWDAVRVFTYETRKKKSKFKVNGRKEIKVREKNVEFKTENKQRKSRKPKFGS